MRRLRVALLALTGLVAAGSLSGCCGGYYDGRYASPGYYAPRPAYVPPAPVRPAYARGWHRHWHHW